MLAAAQTSVGTGLENPLAGEGFGTLGSPISHRGDHGAACHDGPESGAKITGRMGGVEQAASGKTLLLVSLLCVAVTDFLAVMSRVGSTAIAMSGRVVLMATTATAFWVVG